MLANNTRIFSYAFDGYWKDVGTIESLWEANMDLLSDKPSLDLGGAWRIYSSNPSLPPHFIGSHAKIKNSLISGGAFVEGYVKNSVIFSGVRIGKGAKIINSVIMPFTVIRENAIVEKSIVAPNCEIMSNSHVFSEDGSIAVIPEGEVVAPVDDANKQVG